MKITRCNIKNLLAIAVVFASASAAHAVYEAPNNTTYLPTAGYYSSITATDGATLKVQLYNVMTPSNFSAGGYSQTNPAFQTLDADPNNSNNILLVYTRESVPKTWDPNNVYNREHLWVDSRLSPESLEDDWYNLRPCRSTLNSSRGNKNYGGATLTGVARHNGSYFFAGDADKGDVARSLFYMATKYGVYSNGSYGPLKLVNGDASAVNEMGDLDTLLHWHYQDGVDNFERRRNYLVSQTQHNRNAYVDHPEYVWAVFGGGNNNSQVTLASSGDTKVSVNTDNATGQSTATVNLGRMFTGATLGTASIVIDKAGGNPTTYDIKKTGSATTAAEGDGQSIDYDHQTRTITVGLNAPTSTAGLKSGTVTINNTDLTSSGAGHGSQDADDTINISATVLDHAKASLSNSSQKSSLNLDFGTVSIGDVSTLTFTLSNLVSTADYTAMLDLDSVSFTGDSAFTSDIHAEKNIVAGTGLTFTITMSTLLAGDFDGTFYLTTSDEDIAGAQTFAPLAINVLGSVAAVPEPASILIMGLAGSALLMRRRK